MDTRLAAAIDQIHHRYGQQALQTLADLNRTDPDMVISTGWPDLDDALGIGGLPRGRITEIVAYGSAGQGALIANVLVEAQRRHLMAVYVDVEGTLDMDLLAERGVDLTMLVVLRPSNWIHGLEMTRDLLVAGGAGVIVLDRVPMWRTTNHDVQLLDWLLREVVSLLVATQSLFLVLSESGPGGDYPEGLALRYFASVRLRLQWQCWAMARGCVDGIALQAEVIKNKIAAPGGVARLLLSIPWRAQS